MKSHINYLPFSIPAKPIRPGQQPTSPSVRPGSSPGIGSALLGMTRLAGGAVMGSNVPNSPSTPSIPSSPNGATIVTPVIRGGKGSEPVVTYSKRIRNAVSTESLNRPLPQGSTRWVRPLLSFSFFFLLILVFASVLLIMCKVKCSSDMSHWRFPRLTPLACFFFGPVRVGLLRFRRHRSSFCDCSAHQLWKN